MTPLSTVLVLSLVSWRLSRLITTDTITRPYRSRILDRWPPSEDSDEHSRAFRHVSGPRDLHRNERGFQSEGVYRHVPVEERARIRPYGPGLLVSCGWCLSVWASAAVVAAAAFTVGVAAPVVCWGAVCGGSALLHVAESRGDR